MARLLDSRMSVQSLPSVSPVVDSTPPRRSSAAESGRDREAFSLPPETPARDEPKPAAASSGPARDGDTGAPPPRSATRQSGATAQDTADAGDDAKAEKPVPSEAGQSVSKPAGKPAPSPTGAEAVKLDAGALTAIANAADAAETEETAGQKPVADGLVAAAQAQASAKPTGTGNAHARPEAGKAGDKEAEASSETEGEAAQTAAASTETALLVAVAPLQGRSEGETPESRSERTATVTAEGKEAVTVAAVAAGVVAPVAAPVTASAAEPVATSGAGAEAGISSVRALADGGRKASGQAVSATTTQAPTPSGAAETAGVATGDVAIPQVDGTAKAAADTVGAKPAEGGKLLDASPAVQPAVDGASLVQQVSAKLDPLRTLPVSEAASQQPGGAGAQASASQPTPLHVVPIEIGLKALSGARQFDIRLDPAELGRVDVNLSISDDGSVSAKLVVDRVETLHLLQRDARTLERAFEQAGLKPSDAGVDISLRDQSDQSAFRQRQQEEGGRQPRSTPREAGADEPVVSVDPAPVRRLVRLGGVDLSI